MKDKFLKFKKWLNWFCNNIFIFFNEGFSIKLIMLKNGDNFNWYNV